ncbi:MAG: hypothetical protein ACKOZY_03975 [Flavobacteriales bacterium]
MNTLAESKRYIDGFSRPSGYNNYAWDVTKKLALEAWNCYLHGIPFRHSINFMCAEFYEMIRHPETGEFIVPRGWFKMPMAA